MKRILPSVLVLALASQLSFAPKANANGAELLGGLIGGFIAGTIIGSVLSHYDQRAMQTAYPQVLAPDAQVGAQFEWEGDRAHGYFEVVNSGYYYGNPNIMCRQIRTVVLDQFGRPIPEWNHPLQVVCHQNQSWVAIQPQYYVVRPAATVVMPPAVVVRPVVPVAPPAYSQLPVAPVPNFLPYSVR